MKKLVFSIIITLLFGAGFVLLSSSDYKTPQTPIKSISSAYTTTINDHSFLFESGTAFTVTLHDETTATGQLLYFSNAGAGTVTISGDINTCSVEIAQAGSLILSSNGDRWYIFSQNNCTLVDCP